jgi:hypothetical protein
VLQPICSATFRRGKARNTSQSARWRTASENRAGRDEATEPFFLPPVMGDGLRLGVRLLRDMRPPCRFQRHGASARRVTGLLFFRFAHRQEVGVRYSYQWLKQ